MSKRVIYVAFWNHKLIDLINYLKEQQYDSEVIGQMEYCYLESQRLDKEPV